VIKDAWEKGGVTPQEKKGRTEFARRVSAALSPVFFELSKRGGKGNRDVIAAWGWKGLRALRITRYQFSGNTNHSRKRSQHKEGGEKRNEL